MRNLPEAPGVSANAIRGDAGQRLQHESAHKHVSGEAIYVDDMVAPADTLHAYVGLSEVARGKITRLYTIRISIFQMTSSQLAHRLWSELPATF